MTTGNVASTRRPAGEDSHRRNIERREHQRGFPRPGLLDWASADDGGGGDLTLTTSFVKVGNCTISVLTPGYYLVLAHVYFSGGGIGHDDLTGALYQDGVQVEAGKEPMVDMTVFTAGVSLMGVFYAWRIAVDGTTLPSVLEIRAKKQSDSGLAKAIAARTRMFVQTGPIR